jgi:hypothetical protein
MERRAEHRYPVWESVALSAVNPAYLSHSDGILLDVSRSGFGVASEAHLELGTEVLMTLRRLAVFGMVRHCRESGDGLFIAGIQITETVPTKTETWEETIAASRSAARAMAPNSVVQ